MGDTWEERAASAAKSGAIKKWVDSELDNLAWYATVDAVAKLGRLNDAKRVLDVGFGWGRIIVGLKRFYPHLELDGIELTPEFVKSAKELVASLDIEGVNLEQGDIYSYQPPSERYDLVYATRVLHYLDDKASALKIMFNATKPGGRLVVLIPNKYNPVQSVTYDHALFSPLILKKLVQEAGYTEVKLQSARFIPGGIAKQFDHTSRLVWLERSLAHAIPTKWFGALAIVSAVRPKSH